MAEAAVGEEAVVAGGGKAAVEEEAVVGKAPRATDGEQAQEQEEAQEEQEAEEQKEAEQQKAPKTSSTDEDKVKSPTQRKPKKQSKEQSPSCRRQQQEHPGRAPRSPSRRQKQRPKKAADEAKEPEDDTAKNAAPRATRKRKDIPEEERNKRQSYEIPTYNFSQWSIYWTKNAVGLKLKNVETDCGKQACTSLSKQCVTPSSSDVWVLCNPKGCLPRQPQRFHEGSTWTSPRHVPP